MSKKIIFPNLGKVKVDIWIDTMKKQQIFLCFSSILDKFHRP